MTAPDHPDWVGLSTNLGVFTALFSGVIAHGQTTGVLDVTAYESLVIDAGSATPVQLHLDVVDANTGQLLAHLSSLPTGVSQSIGPLTLPLNTGQIVVQNNSGIDCSTIITATNRNVLDRARRPTTLGIDQIVVGSSVIPAGTTLLGTGGGQGQAFTTLSVGGATLAGFFVCLCDAVQMTIADTTQFHTAPNGDRFLQVPWVAPINPWQWQFLCTTGATSTIGVSTVYL